MCVEYAQIRSTVVRLNGIDAGYRITHKNHPCVRWASESLSNWKYVRDLLQHLGDEYTYRYGKCHKSAMVGLGLPTPSIEDIGITPFALAMPDQYRNDQNAVSSYRKYYIFDKNAHNSYPQDIII
jgi:hypothetical protein